MSGLTTNQAMDRIRRIMEDEGIIIHGFDEVKKNRLGGVELDVALTVPAEDEGTITIPALDPKESIDGTN